jgi:energy-coupling factor transporter ATP-binding protein EcfA2
VKNVIVITGVGGCGKSTFAAALAAKLAREGYGTLLISPDTHVPAFGMWVPDDAPQISLGKLLEKHSPDIAEIAEAIHIPPGLKENLALLGYLKGEKSDRYSPASEDDAAFFLRIASGLADVTVIDGTGDSDGLTAAAIRESALRVRLLEPTVRGFLYMQSRPPERADRKSIWVACPWWYADPVDKMAQMLCASFTARVPWSQEAREKLNEGFLFRPYREKRYRTAVEQVATAVKEVTA